MVSLLEHKLIVVTGKGGTGKSTVAGALGLIAAQRGLRTIIVEVGAQRHMANLFAGAEALADGQPGDEIELQENLWSTSVDLDRVLIEWLHALTGRISARLLASSNTFQYLAAAAPGAKELVSMIKVRELCEVRDTRESTSSNPGREVGDHAGVYDLVVLDAPATGHALAMLRSPQTFAAIVRVGPLAEQASRVRELLEDPRRTGYVAVTHASEMAVTETLELEEGLRSELDRDLDAVVVNGTVPRRFTREELERIAALDVKRIAKLNMGQTNERDAKRPARHDTDSQVVHSATRTARAAYERARVQQSQIARLRRQRFADGMPPGVVTIPLTFTPKLDLEGVRDISTLLERKL
jgi:anion-transporting  ArsA/GET3 family ATPase